MQIDKLQIQIHAAHVCSTLSFSLESGQCWGILGGNGVGKSTMIHTLAGLRKPDSGRIHLYSKPIETYSRKNIAKFLGVLLQEIAEYSQTTVLESVLIGRHPHLHNWQWEDKTDYAIARQALRDTSLEDFENRTVNTLSGGERRRVSFATLLTQQPKLLLLDEPTNHLDLMHQITLLNFLINYIKEKQGGIIMALHDVNLASRFCDRILFLFGNGETLCGTSKQMLTVDNLSRLYGYPIREITDTKGHAFVPE